MPSISGSNSKCKAGLFLAKRTLLSILHNKLNFSGLQIYCKKREREGEREREREEEEEEKERKKKSKTHTHTPTHPPKKKKKEKRKKEKTKKTKKQKRNKKRRKNHVSTCPYFQCGRSESRLKPRWAALYRRAQISLPALASFQC